MICERCGTNVTAGRLVVRRTFAGFACYGCAEEVRRIEWEERQMAKKNGTEKGRKVAGRATAGASKAQEATENGRKGGSLASIIDPMLLAGGHTTQEIAAELAKKAGEAAKGKDLAANVRARMLCGEFPSPSLSSSDSENCYGQTFLNSPHKTSFPHINVRSMTLTADRHPDDFSSKDLSATPGFSLEDPRALAQVHSPHNEVVRIVP